MRGICTSRFPTAGSTAHESFVSILQNNQKKVIFRGEKDFRFILFRFGSAKRAWPAKSAFGHLRRNSRLDKAVYGR